MARFYGASEAETKAHSLWSLEGSSFVSVVIAVRAGCPYKFTASGRSGLVGEKTAACTRLRDVLGTPGRPRLVGGLATCGTGLADKRGTPGRSSLVRCLVAVLTRVADMLRAFRRAGLVGVVAACGARRRTGAGSILVTWSIAIRAHVMSASGILSAVMVHCLAVFAQNGQLIKSAKTAGDSRVALFAAGTADGGGHDRPWSRDGCYGVTLLGGGT